MGREKEIMKLLKCMISEAVYCRCQCYSWIKSIVCWEWNWSDLLILPTFAFSNYISVPPGLCVRIRLSVGPFLSCGQQCPLSSWKRLRQGTYAEEGAPQISKSPSCPFTSRSQPHSRKEQGPCTGKAIHFIHFSIKILCALLTVLPPGRAPDLRYS